MFKAADKLRGNMEPSDYKHVALGLIFQKYISDTFEAKRTALLSEDEAAAEDKDESLADNVFWGAQGRADRICSASYCLTQRRIAVWPISMLWLTCKILSPCSSIMRTTSSLRLLSKCLRCLIICFSAVGGFSTYRGVRTN